MIFTYGIIGDILIMHVKEEEFREFAAGIMKTITKEHQGEFYSVRFFY